MTAFISRLCLLALLLVAGTALGPAAHAYTATGTLPSALQVEIPGSTWDTVVADATAESTPAAGSNGGTPIYHSTKLEETTLEGDFTADINTTSLAIFSDDGSDVTIDGVKVWGGRDQGQALENLPVSLHKLPITLNAGQTYHIKIDYSNTYYTGDGDIDGVTLFTWADPLNVTVDLSGVDSETLSAGVKGSGPITASVSNAPQTTATCTVTSVEWNWDFGNLQYSTDGETNWGLPPDGTAYSLTIDNYTIPNTNFNMTLDPGYWSVILTATVTYHTTCGDISGSDWDYVGQTYTYAPPDMRLPEIARPHSLFHTASFDGSLLRRSHTYRQTKPAKTKRRIPISTTPAPLITIIGLDDTTKQNPGGLVVLNADGNGAPAQKIVVAVTHGTVGQSLTITFQMVKLGSGVVQVYDPDTKAYLTFNNTDNVFSIKPETPKTLYVYGIGSGSVGTGITGYSGVMRDVKLTAAANGITDKAYMTVLWVDTPDIDLAHTDPLPNDTGPVQITDHRMGWLDLVTADVFPSAFNYPSISSYYDNTVHPYPRQNDDQRLHLTRDAYCNQWWQRNGVFALGGSENWSSVSYGAGNDTSPCYNYAGGRHDFPAANNGMIDDKDDPGLVEHFEPANTTGRVRWNFRAFAVVTLPSQQSAPIRCSPILGYFVRFEMENGNTGVATENFNWRLLNPPVITSDLLFDLGTTPVSQDLN